MLGFSACFEALDSSRWALSKCPVASEGNLKGKEKVPTLRVEAVCANNLRTWHAMSGVPCSLNDKTIMDNSNLFNDVRNGK